MASIKLTTALELICYNHNDSQVATVLKATIEELERLQEIERHAANLAYAIQKDATVTDYSRGAADAVLKLAKVNE